MRVVCIVERGARAELSLRFVDTHDPRLTITIHEPWTSKMEEALKRASLRAAEYFEAMKTFNGPDWPC